MKNLFRIIFALVLCSGCSDFQHMHYRNLKKVPATGVVAAFVAPEKKIAATGNILPVSRAEEKRDPMKADSLAPKAEFEKVKAVHVNGKMKTFRVTETKIAAKTNRIPMHADRRFPAGKKNPTLRIIGLLLLGLLLITYGCVIIFGGFIAASMLLILLGILVVLLGVLPFAGLISMMAGDRTQDSKNRFEEKK